MKEVVLRVHKQDIDIGEVIGILSGNTIVVSNREIMPEKSARECVMVHNKKKYPWRETGARHYFYEWKSARKPKKK